MKGKGKKTRKKLKVVTGTQRQGYCSDLFGVVRVNMHFRGIISKTVASLYFVPILHDPLICSGLSSDTLVQHPGHLSRVDTAG